uniref:Uncharacterized protein n=1 Tax=Meloidogyne hapla TaxID=6305 RepID=A0A1I8BXX0_MELHA
MNQQKQQYCLIKTSKNKTKTLPLELLINIFREANNLFSNGLKKCQTTYFEEMVIKNKMATTKKQTRKYWYKYAKNLLTSSGITYLFVGEDFNKIKVDKTINFLIKTAEFPISNMSDNETANVLKLLESSPSEAEREMVRAFILKRSAAELKQKQIFIWDMDSFFTFLPQQHADQISFNHMTEQSLEKLVKNGFKSDASCNLVNIKDAQIDEEKDKLRVVRNEKDKLRVVRNVYEQNKDPTALLLECEISGRGRFRVADSEYADSDNSNCVNIVLSIKRNLVEALGLLIIGEMAEFIQPENVFCINSGMEADVFERLTVLYDKNLMKIVTSNEHCKVLAEKNKIHYSYVEIIQDLEVIRSFACFNYCSNCDKHIDVGLAANNWKLHFQKCEGVKNKRKLETDEDEESEKTKKKK